MLSTAYHPQRDRQREQQDQTLEQYLFIYVNYLQENRECILPLGKFAYNNSKHALQVPHEIMLRMGFTPA
jgi:hypothetical protein